MALKASEGTLSPGPEPTLRDVFTDLLAKLYGGGKGGQAMGRQASGLLDWLPGTGEALSATEGKQAWDEGDYVGAALGAAGAIPGAGKIVKGGKKAVKAGREAFAAVPGVQSAAARAAEVSGKVDPDVARYAPGIDLKERKTITPEDFKEGDRIIDVLGDTTMAGPKVTHVGGVELKNPKQTLGGSDFMRHGGGWANTEKTAQAMVKNNIAPAAQQAAEEGGRTFLNFSPMGGGASASSRHVSDILQDLMFQAEPTARGKQQVLDTLTQYAGQANLPFNPEWNEEVIANLVNSLPMTKRGDFSRKFILPTWQKQGLPDLNNVLNAVNDPDIGGLAAGMGGHNFSEVSPEALDVFKTDHFDYAGGIPAEYAGSFDLNRLLPLEDMQMDWSRGRRADPDLQKKALEFSGGKRDIIPAWEQRALLTQVPAQRVTNEWVDNAMRTYERLQSGG